jgi:hypothetical protein
LLEKVGAAHPEVGIGSYPRWRDPEYKVKLTFDGLDAAKVDAAVRECVAGLPPEAVLRVE